MDLVIGINPELSSEAYLVGSMSSVRVKGYPVVEKLVGVLARWINIGDVIPPGQLLLVLEE